MKMRFDKLKSMFSDHRSSRTEGGMRLPGKQSDYLTKPTELELKRIKSRIHRMSNIEELMGKKESLIATQQQ